MRDHQRLVLVDEVEDDPEFGIAVEAGAGIGPDHGTFRCLERCELGIVDLVHSRDPGKTGADGRTVRF